MDTPQRNQINNPPSNYEDPQVYSFIYNLSPVKPLEPAHIPPTVFTSPRVNCLKESRFLKRHNSLWTSKHRVSYVDVNTICSSEEALTEYSIYAPNNLGVLQENAHRGISVGDGSMIELCGEPTNFSVEPQQGSNNNLGFPIYYPPLCGDEANSLLPLPGEGAPCVAYVPEVCKTDSFEGIPHLQGMCQTEPKIAGQECDWDSLAPDATDVLIFNSQNEAEAYRILMQESMEYSAQIVNYMSLISQSMVNDGGRVHSVPSLPHSEPIAAATDRYHRQDNTRSVALMAGNTNEKVDNECGTRRRCLDFAMASTRRLNSDDNLNIVAYKPQTDQKSAVNEMQTLPAQCIRYLQRCNLPGIGLPLNAFGPTSLLPLSAIKDYQHQPLLSTSSERELDRSENGALPAEDCSQASGQMGSEDFNQNIPKRRRKLEPAGETEGCKRCKCKKSKCLKLYCECFAAGVYCTEPCFCQDCFNKPIHEDTVLQARKDIKSRNPLAFVPKVIRSCSDSAPEIGDDPNKTLAPARHKRGCNCKKSSCSKKYCECYQGGVGCSISCRCEGCKNAYGRKDGSAPLRIEAKPDYETEACEKSIEEKPSQKTEILNIGDHPDPIHVSTRLQQSRSLHPLPLSSEGNSSGSFVATISNGLYPSQKLGKPNSLWSQPMHVQTAVAEDEIPDVLGGNNSPLACVKTSSPNSKRVSSPKCILGPSSGRGGRKLIFRSTPSFPSLPPY